MKTVLTLFVFIARASACEAMHVIAIGIAVLSVCPFVTFRCVKPAKDIVKTL